MKVKVGAKVRKEVWWALAVTAVAIACIWPWQQMKKLAAQQQQLEQQREQVQTLAAQAEQLRSQLGAQTHLSSEQMRALVVSALGDGAQLTVNGGEGVLTLEQVPGATWVRGLEVLRQNAGVRIAQATLDIRPQGVSGRVQLQWGPS